MNRHELVRMFLDEAGRNLAESRSLAAADAPPREDLQQLYRHLHSIKGMAVSLGLEEVAALAHDAEDRVERLRDRGVGPRDLAAVRASIESIAGRLAALRAGAPPDPDAAGAGLPRVDLSRVPVAPAHLDRLLEVALELAATHQRLEHVLGPLRAGRELYTVRSQLAGTVRGLRREVLEIRLLPVRELVGLLEESLRAWAAERGLRVAFVVRGEAVRVDRAILERLLDPIGHLLRNAIVHGIEAPSARRAAGKPERATIEMNVRRDGERLRVDVRDDGRGLDVAALHARLARRWPDLPAPDDPGAVDALLSALASSGGSSRQSADRMSGRGIGVSAARSAVERLGGTLTLDSEPGRGFTGRLVVPTRVSVIRAFVAETAGETFAIPVAAVHEVDDVGVGEEREPAVPLGACVGLGERPGPATPRRARLALGDASRPVIVSVDDIRGPLELIVRPLGAPLDGAGLPWAGAALLPEGGLALVVDAERLRPPAVVPGPAVVHNGGSPA